MSEDVSNPLIALIKEQGLIDAMQHEEVLGEFKRTGKPRSRSCRIPASSTWTRSCRPSRLTWGAGGDFPRARPDAGAAADDPAKTARMYQCLPVSQADSTLQVALAEPLNPGRIDELGSSSRRTFSWWWRTRCRSEGHREVLSEENESFNDILKELGKDSEIAKEVKEVEVTDDAALMPAGRPGADCPVREPGIVPGGAGPGERHSLRAVRDRVQDSLPRGRRALRDVAAAKQLALPVVSRLKVMANLNISERRLPQDGRITYPMGSKVVDLRVSTLRRSSANRWCCACWIARRSTWKSNRSLPKYLYDYITEAILRPTALSSSPADGLRQDDDAVFLLTPVNTIDSKLLTAEDRSNTTSRASCRWRSTRRWG